MRGQASSSQARRSQGEAPDELPALRDDSSDEDEPVSGARIDGSPGTSDFFDASPGDPSLLFTFTAVDEDVMTAASALRHLTLETQSRGKLHPHGLLYVAHSRVKNVASVHTYVAMQVCGQGPDGCRRLATTRRNISRCARFCVV